MARPSKSKKVLRLPSYQQFFAEGREDTGNQLILSVEEYEALRLLDYLGMNQEEAAKAMEVGRGTVQMLYAEARKKTARFLVEGTPLGSKEEAMNLPGKAEGIPMRTGFQNENSSNLRKWTGIPAFWTYRAV